MYTKSIDQRIKRSNYAHLLTDELLAKGIQQEWPKYYGGRSLGAELLPSESRKVSQAFGDLILDILMHKSAQ